MGKKERHDAKYEANSSLNWELTEWISYWQWREKEVDLVVV